MTPVKVEAMEIDHFLNRCETFSMTPRGIRSTWLLSVILMLEAGKMFQLKVEK